MNMYTIYGKSNCPFCVKAKELLTKKGVPFNYIEVTSREELLSLVSPMFEIPLTVPVVMKGDILVGGYTELERRFADKKRTVFNLNNKGHETGEYPLFFGEELGFVDSINRPYPILESLFQEQMAQIWNEFEVDLTQDRQDMLKAPREVTDLMVKTILWQHLADSVASRSITGILSEFVSNSDLEGLYNAIALFETIHAKTYAHIIKQTFVDPNQALREGYKDLEVITRSNNLRDAFDNLANMDRNKPLREQKKLLYIALSALYMLEAVNFKSSFAITFGIAETGIFQGIAQDVVLIDRDESLHARSGGEILKIEQKAEKDIFNEIRPTLQILFDDIIRTEKEWTDYLFSEGRQVVGLTPRLIKEYVDYAAIPVAKLLGLEHSAVNENPLPYMDKYTKSGKTQVAAQEMQLTSYLLNSVSKTPNLESEVSKLRDKYR